MNFLRWLYNDLKHTLSNNVGAVNFDGTNDAISCGTGASVGVGGATFSFWMYSRNNAGYRVLMSKCDTYANGNMEYQIVWKVTTEDLGIGSVDGMSYFLNSSTNLAENTWYHVVITGVDGAAPKLYINGVYSEDGDGNVEFDSDTTSETQLGDNNHGQFFDGILDEVAIWNTVLTTAEIALLASKVKGMPLQIQKANLQMYLPLDDHPHNNTANTANGLVFKDRSANTNDGTATGCNAQAEEVLSYPDYYSMIVESGAAPPVGAGIRRPYYKGRW